MADEEARITSELMRAPLDGFVAARAEAVRGLRKQGQPQLATRMASLRKPSVVLWALNQAATAASVDLDALRHAGDALRRAQERLLGGDRAAAAAMQHATEEQRHQLDVITRRLGMLLAASGHGAQEGTMRRISDGLRAASIADEETWSALRQGRLLAEPDAATFPLMDVALAPAALEQRAERDSAGRKRRREAAEAEVRRAQAVADAAREQAEQARLRHERALSELERARARLADLDPYE